MTRFEWLALAMTFLIVALLLLLAGISIGATLRNPTPQVVERILPYEIERVREVTRIVPAVTVPALNRSMVPLETL